MSHNIVLLESDIFLAQQLLALLRSTGRNVIHYTTAQHLYQQPLKQKYEVAIVDQDKLDGDCFEVIEYFKDTHYQTRVMVLGEQKSPEYCADCLHRGADEYIRKPLAITECLARINKLLRYHKINPTETLSLGNVKLFLDKGIVEVNSEARLMRKKELEIIKCLLLNKNKVVTRKELIEMVWTFAEETPTHATIDVYLRRIRMLLTPYGSLIKTVRGFGYMACDPTLETQLLLAP